MYRWARQTGLQDSDAADIVQEVFCTVAQRIDSFEHGGPKHTFRGWLTSISRNKIGDLFRRRAGRPNAKGGTAANQQLREASDSELEQSFESADFDSRRSLIHRAVQLVQMEFEPPTWQAFWRATVEGHRTDIIADELGMSTKAVRQAKYRVLKRLRRELSDEDSEELSED